jgi:hypothetical protein
MMGRLGLGMLMALSLLAPATGRAEGMGNVQELLQDCQQPIVDIRHFFCLGIVQGVSDTMMTNAGGLKMMPKDLARFEANFAFCPDPLPNYGARVQAYKDWATEHPEKWTQPMVIGVMLAMHATWPCDPDHVPNYSK